MRRKLFWIVGCVALLAVMGAGGWFTYSMLAGGPPEPRLTRGPTPSFVIVHEPVAVEDTQFEPVGGVQVLLLDQQYDATAHEPAAYTRMVKRVVNASGLTEAGKVMVAVDPAYQTLVLNHARIVRDGVEEDRSRRVNVDFLRQEPALEFNIVTGHMTAILQMEDVRVDDVVDIALTLRGRHPSFDDRDTNKFLLAYPTPIERAAMRIIWPETAVWKVHDGEQKIKETKSDGKLTLEFGPEPVAPIEATFTLEATELAVLSVSEFANWKEVVAWGSPLYRTTSGERVKAVVDRIRKENAGPDEQIIAALRFVQQDIRYLAIVLGEDGYEPKGPEETLRLRYGDCKAKTALFIAILGSLGIEAYPALVNPMLGHDVQDEIASPLAFNHVIAKVVHGGRSLWFDPTHTHQGGDIDHISQSDYGFGLVLDDTATELERMDAPAFDGLQADVTETFDLSGGHDVPARLDVTGIYRGAMADNLRATLASFGSSQEMVSESYKMWFGEVEALSPPEIEDDLDSNTIRATASLKLNMPFQSFEERHMLGTQATAIPMLVFATKSDADKDRPVPVQKLHTRQSIRFKLPEGPGWQPIAETQLIENEAFRFERTTDLADGFYHVDLEMQTLASSLAPEKIEDVLRDQDRAMSMLAVGLWMLAPKKDSLPHLEFADVPAME